jgi:naphthoate synthase
MDDLPEIRQASDWRASGEFTDIRYETAGGIAKITIARPEVRNAFRPLTTRELITAFDAARDDPHVGVVLLTGEGPLAFSSGGDQGVRGDDGYVDEQGIGRLNVLDLQIQIRRLPKPVIAMVAGYAIGGGHVLHLCCDLTIAADNARFGQTGPRVGSFDAGFGSAYLARVVGEKRARELWFLCRQYDAETAERWGLVNQVVPAGELSAAVRGWADEILALSPTSLRFLKQSFNADTEHLAGIGQLAFTGLGLFVDTDEAQEGLRAFADKRAPGFAPYRKRVSA